MKNRIVKIFITMLIILSMTVSSKCTIFVYAKNNIGDTVLVEDVATYEYTGKEIEPNIELTYQDHLLQIDEDYTIEFQNNIEVGVAEYTITGIGAYEGTITGTFEIVPMYIYDVTIDDSNLTKPLEYNGKKRTPILKLSIGEKALYPFQDYEVEYRNNLNAGTATVIVTGIGNFTGSFIKRFTINKKAIANTTINLTCNKNNKVELKITNPEAGKSLIEKVDYTYTTKIDVKGLITVTILSAGNNYTGTVTRTIQGRAPETVTTRAPKVSVAKTKISAVKNIKKRKITLKWKKIAGIRGYVIRYATNKSMKKANVKKIKQNIGTYTLKKLSIGKTYYIEVQAYKVVSGKTYVGKWSNAKKIKIKK